MIMVIGPHKKKSETRAHAAPPQDRAVPSPRPADTEAPEPAVSEPAADGAAVSGSA